MISVWAKRTRVGQHVLERDAHRVGGAGAAGDPGQLGDHLVVVVPVDQGQLHLGVVAQLGRQAQGDVQPGVARAGDHDLTAAPGVGCGHGVLHGYCPSWEMVAGRSHIPGPAGRWPVLAPDGEASCLVTAINGNETMRQGIDARLATLTTLAKAGQASWCSGGDWMQGGAW